MTFQEEVAALSARIAAAHAERDGWRASGMQQKYLEAYSRAEALESQLEGLRQEGLRATARSDDAIQRDVDERRAAPGDGEQRPQAPDASQREMMAELAITLHDDTYHLGPHRYTRLEDAVKYARLLRTQGRKVD
jgi:hypothetical protein